MAISGGRFLAVGSNTEVLGLAAERAKKIDLGAAIRVGTINGAYASHEETMKGSIVPGKLADLVVLGQDPFHVDPLQLVNIPVERTMVGVGMGSLRLPRGLDACFTLRRLRRCPS